MTMLALRMGLRSIDICNLRLSDICWTSRTISIVQRKTGVPLTLPFPVEVGNLLARYITEARPPQCQEPNLFVALASLLSRKGERQGLGYQSPRREKPDERPHCPDVGVPSLDGAVLALSLEVFDGLRRDKCDVDYVPRPQKAEKPPARVRRHPQC